MNRLRVPMRETARCCHSHSVCMDMSSLDMWIVNRCAGVTTRGINLRMLKKYPNRSKSCATPILVVIKSVFSLFTLGRRRILIPTNTWGRWGLMTARCQSEAVLCEIFRTFVLVDCDWSQVYAEIVKCNRLIRALLPKKTVFQTGGLAARQRAAPRVTFRQFKIAPKAKAPGLRS